MAVQYETLPALAITTATIPARKARPDIVHLEDSAFTVMIDFTQVRPYEISPDETMDNALHDIESFGNHTCLVTNDEHEIQGLISTHDILGVKPAQIIQRGSLKREQVLVHMLMQNLSDLVILDIESLNHAKVGHIVETLHQKKQNYALVVRHCPEKQGYIVRGLFSTPQISRQLHRNVVITLP